MTEKEARDALREAIAQAIYGYDGGRFDSMEDAMALTVAPIDALLAARTEAIASMLDTFAEEYRAMARTMVSREDKHAVMVTYSALSIAAVKARGMDPVSE